MNGTEISAIRWTQHRSQNIYVLPPTEDRASENIQFLKQDQDDAKLKTIRQLK
jgi:hypothetical protein